MNAHAPPGALAPGTQVQVGAYRVTITRYLSRGGFAMVYLVAQEGYPVPLVLKCMSVWNRDALRSVRAEVDHHRKLRGFPTIVNFVEASASPLPNDGWEIFILMEYCEGGALIDFMNTRLQQRLTEAEVLAIFRDVCAAVAVMHASDPPLVHRDLKIENVLLSSRTAPTYKLCDFGSCFPVLTNKPARSSEEIKRVETELNMHTTLQYRAPEMVDLNMHKPINEKADIWALGVLLYKLCYYTTPFEGQNGGPFAILQARFEYPRLPVYSIELRALIGTLIQVDQEKRPSAQWIISRIDAMRGKQNIPRKPVTKVAAPPRPSSMPTAQRLPSSVKTSTPSPALASKSSVRAPTPPEPAPSAAAQAQAPPKDALISLDDTDKRFPTIEELDTPLKGSVRTRVAGINAGAQARAQKQEHTSVLVSVDSSDDEGPEDVDTYVPVVRARPKEDTVLSMGSPSAAARPTGAEVRPDPGVRRNIAALFEPQSFAPPKKPLLPTQNAPLPKADPELDTLAQQEKELTDLLGTELVSVETDTPSAPAPAAQSVAAHLAPPPAALRAPPWEDVPPTQDAPPADAASEKQQERLPGTSARSAPTTAAASPPRTDARPPRTAGKPPRPGQKPALAQPRRASTWDTASKPAPAPAPKPKQYVDKGTSPFASPEIPSKTLSQAGGPARTRSDSVAQSDAATKAAKPPLRPKPAKPAEHAQSDAQLPQVVKPVPVRAKQSASAEAPVDSPLGSTPAASRAADAEHPPPELPTPTPVPGADDKPKSDTKPHAPPNLMDEDDPPLGPVKPRQTVGQQRTVIGQPRLTKRPTQSGAGAAVSLQPREQQTVPAPPPSEPETDFQGVGALINRWQSLGK